MCYHKRIIYTCGHDGWGTEISACDHQRAFDEGSWPIACPDMFAHPLHSVKVQRMCKDCNWKAARTADKLTQVKMAMRELNETVRKLKMSGASEVEGLEDVEGRVEE
jgi:hypothetical protein